ncbi:MAG TPA: hypothetical protein VM935_01970 [Chitinophagaceae bacterium]|nr:hypothetical protein [Chitinophagaceae bacterium]
MFISGIITGDIVASQAMPVKVRQKLFSDVNQFLKELKKSWIQNFETFRGDSLQCEVKSPELALRTSLIIRAYFKSYLSEAEMPKAEANRMKEERTKGYFTTEFDVRLSLGIGEVDFLTKNKISSSDGQAFRLSGEALDGLKQEPHRMVVKTLKPPFDEQIEPSILLLDAIIQKWTQNGAELVLHLLQNKKEEEIAALLNISQSAVNQRKKNAQWFAIEKLITYFEKTVKSWI